MSARIVPAPRARWFVVALAMATVGACKDSTPPLVPTTLVATLPSIALDAIGAVQSLAVSVKDQNGAAMSGVTVAWTSSAPSVVTVSGGASATATAVGDGTATLTARAGTAQAVVQVTVTQMPVAPVKLAGDAQTGTVGAALATQLRIRVQDRLANPMAGRSVTFAPGGANAGSTAPSTVTSGADGTAVTTWTLGTLPGAQAMVATALGSSETATFNATAIVGPPASVVVNAGNNQTAIAGSPVATAPAARVADAFGNAVPGVTVTFAATAANGTVTGGAATTNASGVATAGGWTLGTVAGAMTLTATVAGLAPATFTATAIAGPAAAVIVNSGNAQSALVSTAVAVAPAVRVNDVNGNAVAGSAVTFAVASGGGSATGTTAVTSAGGIAAVGSWTLGPAPGANTLTATVTGTGITGNPVTFTATGTVIPVAAFNITLRYLSAVTPSQLAAFSAAAARWQAVITSDLSDVASTAAAGTCGSNSPALNETIDDLLIFVTLEAIDGVGGTLGSAGPCYIRTTGGLPIVGRMRFDVADIAMIEAQGLLSTTILHEMGHVVGVGTLWNVPGFFSFLVNPSLPSSPGVDTRYTGANGIVGFDAVGGSTYTLGGKVPVENSQGGTGTRDGHWRESVLANELMTGFISLTSNPFSLLTVRSLLDFGYTVNTAQADAFFVTLTAAALSEAGPRVELKNDLTRDPIRVVDDLGRVVRVLRPPED